MKILNLYAGLGGNRTYWNGHDITAIEINPLIAKLYQKRFPLDEVIIQNALEYVRNTDLNQFEFIWASPPCRTHSQMQKFNHGVCPVPDMTSIYGLMIYFEHYYNHFYVIENVQPYYKTIISPTVKFGRHLFWTNFPLARRVFDRRFLGKNRHGKIGGVMREEYDYLIQKLGLSDIKEELLATFKGKKLRTVVRNTVDPEIGRYILNQLQSPGLMSYIDA